MWNPIMWNRCSSGLVSVVRLKNPITGWDRITKTPLTKATLLFLFHLHLLIILCLILSSTCQKFSRWLHFTFPQLPSLASSPLIFLSAVLYLIFLRHTLLFFSPRSFAPFFTSSLLKLISSSLPCLYLCLYFFLIFILYTSRQLHELFPLQDFCKCYLKLIYLNFNLEHQTIAQNRNIWIIYISLSSHSLSFLYQYKPTLPFILSSTDVL